MFLLSLYQQKTILNYQNYWFKRSVYWNKYKISPEKIQNAKDNIKKLIDPSWQGINKLFVLAHLNEASSKVNSHKKYFFPRIKI